MELLVYKASAGSGKTFTLAVEYIKHLIANPRAYRQILAVTFTNKATGEMKERIVQQLYGIWKGDRDSEAYLNRIREDLKDRIPTEELRRRAGTALLYMLHDYSRFRVETIDSFFQSVMRNLARELELSPNLNIELNNAEVLDEAVDSLIEKLTPDAPVMGWLLDYINERIADDKRWNVSDEIKSFGRNIFDESYLEKGDRLRECLGEPQMMKLYKEVLKELETEALEQMKAFSEQFEGELEGHGLAPEDLKGGARGIGSYFRKLKDGKLTDKDVVNATLKGCLADADNWSAKTSKQRKEITDLAERNLMPLLQEAERLRPQRNRTVNSCRLTRQHLNKLQLLNHIDEEVKTLNREQNRFLLSDTNALLHRLVKEGDPSFVFEKIGTTIRNVMIDEFQDTSRMQWDNFRLLLLEGLAQGEDSLIVGDVKQSIYRWRNGDWRILNGLDRKLDHFPIRLETLKVNRRSETNVIDFNNRVFKEAVEYLNGKHLEELQTECTELKVAYSDVAQESPKETVRGYVRVDFLEPDEENDYATVTLEALGEAVKELLAGGVKMNDLAILVRKNRNIATIADYFDRELKVPVVSDEAFRLDASQAVCMLVDALRYLTDETDSVALAALVMNYRTGVKGIAESPDYLTAERLTDYLPGELATRREELRLMPLYELLEELFGLLEMKRLEKQDAYLFAFFDAVTDYLQSHSSDLDGFLHYWDETLCMKTIPSGELEGIRILSIHKSKGLEFHTVLIPFCDWKTENETNSQLVWCSPKEGPYNRLGLVPVNYSPAMAESVYREDYLEERLQLWVDNLNLLYVAFTRAGKNLLVWSRKDQRGTMAELLGYALPRLAAGGHGTWDEDAGRYERGELCASEEKAEREVTNRLARKATKRPVVMESLKHEVEFRQSNRSADFIAGVDEEESEQRFIDRGRLLHTLFSAIRTEADIDEAISRLVFEGVIGRQETEEEIRALTQRAFELPQVKEWYDGTWRLFNECDIIWTENGELRNRRPDRVMMKDGRLVVVDFKFGKPSKQYIRQVKDYMQLLTRMGYDPKQMEGYLWYVTEGRTEKI